MKIYLVEVDTPTEENIVITCFAHQDDASRFVDMLETEDQKYRVVERTLWYGQPNHRGYNP